MSQNALVSTVVVLLVVARFLFRELRERRIRTTRIYLLPGVLGVVGLASLALAVTTKPQLTPSLVGASLVALALGGAVGSAVAHFTTVRVTSEPAVLYARGSFVTVAIWIAALLLRLAARAVFAPGGSPAGGEPLVLDAALLVLLASALFFVRYRLLVAAKRERERGLTFASPAL